MEQQKQLIQPFVYCAVVFITLGIAIANEILARFGLESNHIFVFSIAFLVAGLLLSKNPVLLLFVLLFQFTLVTNHGNEVRRMISEIVQQDLKKIGIQMKIRLIEWTVFISKYINTKNFDATLLGWNIGRDPDAYTIWHSSQTEESQYNFVTYKNKTVDRLLERGRTTFDIKKRKKITTKRIKRK